MKFKFNGVLSFTPYHGQSDLFFFFFPLVCNFFFFFTMKSQFILPLPLEVLMLNVTCLQRGDLLFCFVFERSTLSRLRKSSKGKTVVCSPAPHLSFRAAPQSGHQSHRHTCSGGGSISLPSLTISVVQDLSITCSFFQPSLLVSLTSKPPDPWWTLQATFGLLREGLQAMNGLWGSPLCSGFCSGLKTLGIRW